MSKEVYFHIYCPACKHEQVPEHEDPCDTCMSVFYREYSHKPVKFEERKEEKRKKPNFLQRAKMEQKLKRSKKNHSLK